MFNKKAQMVEASLPEIIKIIENWYFYECHRTRTSYEDGWFNTLINFDFSVFGEAFTEKDYEYNVKILTEFFTTSEQCFAPSRMKLIASEIIMRYGNHVVTVLKDRFIASMVSIWDCPKSDAVLLNNTFPCLWLMHLAQGVALSANLNNVGRSNKS